MNLNSIVMFAGAGIRHVITTGAGFLAAKGYIENSQQEQIIGGAMFVVVLGWTWYQKWKLAGNGLSATGKIVKILVGQTATANTVPTSQPLSGIKVSLLAALAVLPLLVVGCATSANKVVPSSKIVWNAATGEASLTLPKDEAISSLNITRNGSNVTVALIGLNSANNPAVVQAGYAGAASIESIRWQGYIAGLQTVAALGGKVAGVMMPGSSALVSALQSSSPTVGVLQSGSVATVVTPEATSTPSASAVPSSAVPIPAGYTPNADKTIWTSPDGRTLWSTSACWLVTDPTTGQTRYYCTIAGATNSVTTVVR